MDVAARLLHCSDLHFGDISDSTDRALVDALNGARADAVVVSGDFTMVGSTREFRAARRFVDAVDHRVVAVPGNHDVPAKNLFKRFFRPLRRYTRLINPVTCDRFETDELFVLGLNSARPWDLHWNWSHGRVSRRPIEWADGALGRKRDAQLGVLVVHHPLFIPEGASKFRPLGRRDPLLRVLARRRVDVVLTGHLHHGRSEVHEVPLPQDPDAETEGPPSRGILLVQAGTATSRRRRAQPHAFNELVLRREAGDASEAGSMLEVITWTREADGPFEPTTKMLFERDPERPGMGWRAGRG